MSNAHALDVVLSEFLELAKIPRPSHHEEQVSEYLCQWAVNHGLTVEKDSLGDVIIEKPASPGCEDKPLTILQAHMDMVCVAKEGVNYNPVSDPIKVKILEDGFTLVAEGTSLGADDGIGIAICLYLLADESLRHGRIRAIFTTNEEDGMDSVNIDPKYLQGQYLSNLDWEEIGSLCNSCAGGDFFNFNRKAIWEAPAANAKTLNISFTKLLGGHSGVGINKGHANALVSLATALSMLKQGGINYRIASFDGGQAPNAIPKFAKAELTIEENQLDATKDILQIFRSEFKACYDNVEFEYEFAVSESDKLPLKVLSEETGFALAELMTVVPNNVHTMSPFVAGLVESSANLGTISISDDEIKFMVFARSSVDYPETQMRLICQSLADAYGFAFQSEGHVPGWAVNPNSKLVPLACCAYEKITGKKMVVEPVHAGVECGAFAIKNPGLDMIAIGPTLLDVHTPNESCNLNDVKIITDLIAEILRTIAE